MSIVNVTKALKNTTGREIDPTPMKSTLLRICKSVVDQFNNKKNLALHLEQNSVLWSIINQSM